MVIERDLKEVLDPHYYAKQYQKVKEDNQKKRIKKNQKSNDSSGIEHTPQPLEKERSGVNLTTSNQNQRNKTSVKMKSTSLDKKKNNKRNNKDKYDCKLF
jgi:hypothetical protein